MQLLTAFVAFSARVKMMLAIPLLSPRGPYESSTRLTGPMVLAKYSYLSQDVVSYLDFDYSIMFLGVRFEVGQDGKKRTTKTSTIVLTRRRNSDNTASEQRALVVTSARPVSSIQFRTGELGTQAVLQHTPKTTSDTGPHGYRKPISYTTLPRHRTR